MIYADFEYYRDVFHGTKIKEQAEFEGLVVKATADLDMLTFGRINPEAPISESVKNAMCAIAETRKAYESGEAGIASASIGKKSVTYANADKQTYEKDSYKAAYPFLVNTGLLYRGFYPGESR